MGEDEQIRLDGSRLAPLQHGAASTDFPTLQDSIKAWHRLRPERAQKASIRIIDGQLYVRAEISKLLLHLPIRRQGEKSDQII
jgi:hypothetical protein